MRMKIKDWGPSSICFPREAGQESHGFQSVLSHCPLFQMQGCAMALTAAGVTPALPGKHSIVECSLPCALLLLAITVYTGTAFFCGHVCCWSKLSKIMVQDMKRKGQIVALSLQRAREQWHLGDSSFPPRAFSSRTWCICSMFCALALPVPLFISISQHVSSEPCSYVIILVS